MERAEDAVPVLPASLLAETPDVISVHAVDGTALWVSASSVEVLGVAPQELVGTQSLRRVHPDDRSALGSWLQDLESRPGARARVSFRVLHRDGGYRQVESTLRLAALSPGAASIVASTRDVSDRSQTEAALRHSEQRHRQLVESTPVGLCVVDAEGRLRFVNPTALQLAGERETGAVLGRPVVGFVQPEERERCRAAVVRAIELGERPAPQEYHLLRPDGRPLVVLAGPLPYTWEGETAALVVMQDVTPLRVAEAGRERADDRFARLLEASAEGVVGLDVDARVTFMNPAASELLGHDADAALGADAHALWHHTRRNGSPYPREGCPCVRAAEQGVAADVDGEVFWRPDGAAVPVAYRVFPLRTDEQSGAVLTFHDVSERDAARDRLSREAELRSAVLDSLPSLTAVLDRDGRVVAVNDAWRRYARDHGGDPARVGVGVDVLAVLERTTGSDRPLALEVAAGVRDVLAGRVREHQSEVSTREAGDGSHFSLSIVPLGAAGGGAVMAYTDVTERRRLELRAAHQATHDDLTGLPNRVLLLDRLGQALAGRSGQSVGVLYLDLDGFKLVNEAYGHEAGDQLLVQLSERLSASVRPQDTVARTAGDEFVVLCTGFVGRFETEVLALRLLAAVARPFVVGSDQVALGVSIGIALGTDDLDDPPALLLAAGQAMFDAKARGRNRFRFYDSTVHGGGRLRLAQAVALRDVVQRGDLMVHYQPVVDLSDGQLGGAEALLRWRGVVDLPDTSTAIALAEEIGLIGQIDRFVLSEAMTQGATFLDGDGTVLPLAVNVAPQELDDGLVQLVEDTAANAGYPLGALTLELTERSVMADPHLAVSVLVALRERGVRIALDDFGVGQSSLASLRHLPLDVLKIDAGFVRGLAAAGPDRRIVRAILQMGRALDLDIVAEGVETAEQRDLLLEMGCERGQGWFFSSARTPEALRLLPR